MGDATFRRDEHSVVRVLACLLVTVAIRESLLTTTQIGTAVVIGAVAQVAVIASLYLRIDIDWRFQRLSAAQHAAAADR